MTEGTRTLELRVIASDGITDDFCGNCIFINWEHGPYCQLFGNEELSMKDSGDHHDYYRVKKCLRFERTGDLVSLKDQEPPRC